MCHDVLDGNPLGLGDPGGPPVRSFDPGYLVPGTVAECKQVRTLCGAIPLDGVVQVETRAADVQCSVGLGLRTLNS